MIEFQQSNLNKLRFLAVSATIGNIQEVASWLGVDSEGTLIFGEAERPVPLEIMVLGYMPKSNPFLFDLSLNYKLLDLIRKFGNSKPILIFCSTQKSAMSTANEISRSCEPGEFVRTEMNLQSLVKISSQVQNQNLKACILHGVGFHHAALSPLDRGLAESSFRNLLTPILCTTSTLALGMNLPAYLVIIKGTYGYRKGAGFEEMTTSEIKQMGGRAGRKGFESHGLVIVMTEKSKVDFWRNELSNEACGTSRTARNRTKWIRQQQGYRIFISVWLWS